VGEELIAGVSFQDLGVHRLRGLPEPEALFQLVVADLPDRFPPLVIGPG
jgi:class 3 adenylate cyclase